MHILLTSCASNATGRENEVGDLGDERLLARNMNGPGNLWLLHMDYLTTLHTHTFYVLRGPDIFPNYLTMHMASQYTLRQTS